MDNPAPRDPIKLIVNKSATIIVNPSWVTILTPDGASVALSTGAARSLANNILELIKPVAASEQPIPVDNWPTRGSQGN